MRPFIGLLSGTILLALVAAGCGTNQAPTSASAAKDSAAAASPKEPVLIFAAASTTNAIDEIKTQFKQQSGIDVKTNYAASSTLAQQIDKGADADLFISADTKWADYVAGKGHQQRRRDLLGNRVVIVVPADSKLNIQSAADLISESVKHLAVGDPASVPIGKYAKQALEKLGLWDRVKAKVAAGSDVRQALAFVETGAAEAGIVYATDAAISKKVKVAAEIPEDLTGPVRYPMILLKHGDGNKSAESFCRYLSSPEAAKVFERYGFTVLKDESGGKP